MLKAVPDRFPRQIAWQLSERAMPPIDTRNPPNDPSPTVAHHEAVQETIKHRQEFKAALAKPKKLRAELVKMIMGEVHQHPDWTDIIDVAITQPVQTALRRPERCPSS
jgi:hypothetical protein